MTQDLSILLQQYCELNELPYHASWDKVIEHQISHPNTTIEYHTPYGRLFHLTHQVINNTLEAHTFMTLGDTYNPVSTTPRSGDTITCKVVDHALYNFDKESNYYIITIY